MTAQPFSFFLHTVDDEVYRRQRSYNMWRKGKRTVDDDRRFVQM